MSYTEHCIDALKNAGMKVTPQRRAIIKFLEAHRGHHTPQAVLDAVGNRRNRMSAATVYNTLDTFETLGIVRRIVLGEGRTYYDGNTHAHHHAQCTRCGVIIDLEIPERLEELHTQFVGLNGFTVKASHVHFEGHCKTCNATTSH